MLICISETRHNLIILLVLVEGLSKADLHLPRLKQMSTWLDAMRLATDIQPRQNTMPTTVKRYDRSAHAALIPV